MPPAARKTDVHACPLPGHGPNPVQAPCCSSVLIGNLPAARVTDMSACTGPIIKGSPTVLIGYQQAARIGDPTAHGGTIVTGFLPVLIGEVGKGEVESVLAATMKAAKERECAFT